MFTQLFRRYQLNMKTFKNEEVYIKKDTFYDNFFNENCLFFDIETTGFSAINSNVYMIGCARRIKNRIEISQFFAETPSDEAEIIYSFFEIAKNCSKLISFNGLGFDIPFITTKCKKHNIDNILTGIESIDIFKKIQPIKALLCLDNYKQKTLEHFLGIIREDIYSGGELINIYHDYVETHDENLLSLLQLHNYEDILGMTELIPILSYLHILKNYEEVLDISISNYTSYDGKQKKELLITLKNPCIAPKCVNYRSEKIYISVHNDKTYLRIEIFNGELKHFYRDYKNYYYLPMEDAAIHKSVSTYVDSSYREKCKASNCYVRKAGDFVVQYDTLIQPTFNHDYKEKHSYFLLSDDFISQKQIVLSYSKHIINYLFKL